MHVVEGFDDVGDVEFGDVVGEGAAGGEDAVEVAAEVGVG